MAPRPRRQGRARGLERRGEARPPPARLRLLLPAPFDQRPGPMCLPRGASCRGARSGGSAVRRPQGARGLRRDGLPRRQEGPLGDDLLPVEPRPRQLRDRRHRPHRLHVGRQERSVGRRDDGGRLRPARTQLAAEADEGEALLPLLQLPGHPRAAGAAPALPRQERTQLPRRRDGPARLGRRRAAGDPGRAGPGEGHDRALQQRQRPCLRRRLRGRHDGPHLDEGVRPRPRRLRPLPRRQVPDLRGRHPRAPDPALARAGRGRARCPALS